MAGALPQQAAAHSWRPTPPRAAWPAAAAPDRGRRRPAHSGSRQGVQAPVAHSRAGRRRRCVPACSGRQGGGRARQHLQVPMQHSQGVLHWRRLACPGPHCDGWPPSPDPASACVKVGRCSGLAALAQAALLQRPPQRSLRAALAAAPLSACLCGCHLCIGRSLVAQDTRPQPAGSPLSPLVRVHAPGLRPMTVPHLQKHSGSPIP